MSSNMRSNVTVNANEENVKRIERNYKRKTIKLSSKGTGLINNSNYSKKGLLNMATSLYPNVFPNKNLATVSRTYKNTSNVRRILRARRKLTLTEFLHKIVPIINNDDEDDDEVLRSLLSSLDASQRTEYMKGLLTHAVSVDNLYAAELLLEYGADPNEKDTNEHVPLMKVISPDAARLLLSYKANPAYEIPNPNKPGQTLSLLKYFEYPDHRNAFVIPNNEVQINVLYKGGELIKSIRDVIKGALKVQTRRSVAGGGGMTAVTRFG